jgi:hypothetical protein
VIESLSRILSFCLYSVQSGTFTIIMEIRYLISAHGFCDLHIL